MLLQLDRGELPPKEGNVRLDAVSPLTPRTCIFCKALANVAQIVRIPATGRPKLLQIQIEKLYDAIDRGCIRARERKLSLRMLLNAGMMVKLVLLILKLKLSRRDAVLSPACV
jgi:hypothetical protein